MSAQRDLCLGNNLLNCGILIYEYVVKVYIAKGEVSIGLWLEFCLKKDLGKT